MTVREFDAALTVYKRVNGVKEKTQLGKKDVAELRDFMATLPKTVH